MATKTQVVQQTTSNIPEYARPYYEDLLKRGQAESYRPYIPYGYTQDPKTGEVVKAREAVLGADGKPTYRTVTPSGADEADYKAYLANNPDVAAAAQASGMDPIAFAEQHYRDFGKAENRALTYQPPQPRQEQIFEDVDAQRLAGFTPAQEQVQKDVLAMQRPEQFGSADKAMQSGLDALARTQDYEGAKFSADQVSAERIAAERIAAERIEAERVAAERVGAERVRAAALKEYQLQGPQQFGQEQAQQYISPYVQNVLDMQKQQAIADAQKSQLVQNLGAARQGTYGGSRQLLATTERERALGQQLGNIQATGLQSAYENAQQQFERDRNAQMGVGTTNLNALLGVQSLGADTGLRASLANQQTGLQAGLANQQTNLQAGLANQQTGLQASQANQESALRASLANQSTGLQAAQSNQQTGLQAALANQQQNLEAQRLSEASRQFGANLGLQGAQAYGQMGQTYANVGTAQQQAELQRYNAQNAIGSQQQAQQQQGIDIGYGDFLRQQNYPAEQLGIQSNILRGLPNAVNTTQTTSAPGANPFAQAVGGGLSALSYAKLLG
tara:strand:+ start:1023 stop:2705 length:1683 start_codon:yes stop_codon:yes gene_type:complete